MTTRKPPRLDSRRAREFAEELRARARAWMPDWAIADGERDFGSALLEVASRFDAEVAERLDGAGGKLRDGLFDWLGVHGEAARPARVPVAFKLADTAREAVLAGAPVRLQAQVGEASVTFETQDDVRIVPATLACIAATNGDRFYLPPPGLASLAPEPPAPTRWILKSFAAPGATKLQLDPPEGLSKDMVLQSGSQRVRVTAADKGLVTVEPKLAIGLPEGGELQKVTTFSPFDEKWIDEQSHVLYLGDAELFDIPAEATIRVTGAQGLAGATWQYWGKDKDNEVLDWHKFDPPKVNATGVELAKPKGAVELREIVKDRSARWIRALSQHADRIGLAEEEIRIAVNPMAPLACRDAAARPSVAVDAMFNTTPLVTSRAFQPLGREPRQFDTFYLGSNEAFSKKNASVQLCFEMADLSLDRFACLRSGGPLANTVLAGVTRDGGMQLLEFDPLNTRLRRMHDRGALHPPSPGLSGAIVDGAPIRLPQGAMAIWDSGQDVLVAVASDDAVWVWREVYSDGRLSGWMRLPEVPFGTLAANQQKPAVADLVYVPTIGMLVALRNGTLSACSPESPNPTWSDVTAEENNAPVEFSRIAPIVVVNPGTTVTPRIVGVSTNNGLYTLTVPATFQATCVRLRDDVAADVAPAAILHADDTIAAVAIDRTTGDLVGVRGATSARAAFQGMTRTSAAIDAGIANGRGVFAAIVGESGGATAFARWSPFEAPLSSLLFTSIIPGPLGPATGVPTILPGHVVVPVTSSQVLLTGFDPEACKTLQAPLGTAVIVVPGDVLAPADLLAFPVDGSPGGFVVAPASETVQLPGQILYRYDVRAAANDLRVYPDAVAWTATNIDPNDLTQLVITAGPVTAGATRVLVRVQNAALTTHLVVAFDQATQTATLDPAMVVGNPPPATVDYKLPEPAAANANRIVAPVLKVDPNTTGNWKAEVLDRTTIAFPGQVPERQKGKALAVDALNRPAFVTLGLPWTAPVPPTPVTFVVDEALKPWSSHLADLSSNPELSWEYWNGTNWQHIPDLVDSTGELKHSGDIRFSVPRDLRQTDWAGKTSHWIRARLVSGDYGREQVSVLSSPTSTPDVTRQVVDRNTDAIRAPNVVWMHLSYGMGNGVEPTWVLAQDSGTIRDQSDANRTDHALVEAFVPLSVRLGDASAPFTDRALFLGFKGALDGAVRLYARLRERVHEAQPELRVETLVADRFVPVQFQDDTHALAESGMLALTIDAPPTQTELFGQSLQWLRISSGDPAWAPVIEGIHVNAVWASAAETMTYERVGSSDGAPRQVLSLARPPVLRDSLELRVREPLGDEERDALLAGDERRVLSDVADLPGDWVRWNQVVDPEDEAADARVYALDEKTGEMVFGDGTHGMIPPAGRDSIVAFRYRRTEIPADAADTVPANALALRGKLDVASPVRSVEAVFAADQAAGGAPPESTSRILRFGGARLRHRQRAISAHDFEDLAMQASPDVAQARCLRSGRKVRVIVAMRGANPTPTAAQRRALRQALLDAAPVAIAAARAVDVEGPRLRWLGVTLRLRVRSLDDAAAVEADARGRMIAWLDPATGGAEGTGWPLGRSIDVTDIARAISGRPRLSGIADIALHRVDDEGVEHPWPASIGATDLVVLRTDAVRVAFEAREETA